MGSTRKCMEQAVFLCSGGEDSHAGNQRGKFIENIPGKTEGKRVEGQRQGNTASADAGDPGGKGHFLCCGGGGNAGVYRAKRRGEEQHDQGDERHPDPGQRDVPH